MLDKIFRNTQTEKPFLKIFSENPNIPPPIWFMRQAGRYLPEYRELRLKTSNFLEFCYSPDKASEATLQPLKRFEFDAAIIFSDILVIPDALGVGVSFKKGEGPVLNKIQNIDDIEKLKFDIDHLKPVYEAIKITSKKINKNKALIGFAGAPWTLATYMIEGGSSRDFINTKKWAYSSEESFSRLINILVESVSSHLIEQVKNGAEVLQIFDSWAGALTSDQFEKWVIEPTAKIISNVKLACPDTPVIGFPKGAGTLYKKYAEQTGVDAISFDQNIDPVWIKDNINIPVQGNLDPLLLAYNKDKAVEKTRELLTLFEGRPFIFNLGHGIIPQTPLDNVSAIVNTVKEYG